MELCDTSADESREGAQVVVAKTYEHLQVQYRWCTAIVLLLYFILLHIWLYLYIWLVGS